MGLGNDPTSDQAILEYRYGCFKKLERGNKRKMRTCEDCSKFKKIPTTHKIYSIKPDSKVVVNCPNNILMAYHEYSEGAEKYQTIAVECSNFDDMDEE